MLKPQEIGNFVACGGFEVGITGLDWLVESQAEPEVKKIQKLGYAKDCFQPTRIVLAAGQDSNINSVRDLSGCVVATEFVNITKKYLADAGVDAEVEYSWGSTEAKAPELSDAVVDITSTGKTLEANGLEILDTVFTSAPYLIANSKNFQNPSVRSKVMRLAKNLKPAVKKLELQAEKSDMMKWNYG